jgi:NAD(P)-dependent dehydrogenase (short-subunit alcohol dehydrogenase family)
VRVVPADRLIYDAVMNGKHIVVTGGTGALGGAVVSLLLERGATCHVPMIEAAVPEGTPWSGHASVVATPGVALTDEGAVESYYAALPPLWGSVHLAGGFAMAPITETRLADFEKMHGINAITAFLAAREAVRAMRKSGGGRILNVVSRAALAPGGGTIAYTASKAEVAALTQALAAEVLRDGILVNAIAPSTIDTPANRAAMPKADFSTWTTPAEIAEVIAFLVSPSNTLISGALVPVYGRA